MVSTDPVELERQKLKTVVSSIKEGIILIDSEQSIIYMNKSAEDLLGCKYMDVMNQPIGDHLSLIDSEDKAVDPNVFCPIGGIDMDGVIYKESNLSLVDKNDVIKIVNLESRKMQGGSHINFGAVLIIENVFKESELERMKVDFVSMSVHVLRTPLTIVRGFLSTLNKPETKTKLSDRERTSLDSAITGADTLYSLVENLLHLTEIQTGKFHIYPTPINFEGLVGQTVNEMKNAAAQKGLTIKYIAPLYEFPMIRADFSRIKEVIRNLLDNAIKFTDKGDIVVTISKENSFVKTAIKDSGKGIAQSNLHYIFTKFYRIKDPLEMEQGQGLGLYISKKIVDAHNGEIWVESVEGQGSTFYFTLPLV